MDVRSVTFSPDKNRALARVTFEDPTATAYYDFVLEKRSATGALASVWLGPEMEKPGTRDTSQGTQARRGPDAEHPKSAKLVNFPPTIALATR